MTEGDGGWAAIPPRDEALVVGAGPAGLATAAMIKRRGLAVRVIEGGASVGAAWRERYDGLRLNTVRWLSALPGLRLPRRYGRWVSRDDYVDYLERYARAHRLEVELGTTVDRVDRGDGEWVLGTSRGPRRAGHLVLATGSYRVPRPLEIPGREGFRGRLIHAAAFRSPAEFAGRDVLVVGAGNSGSEIAQQLAGAGAARVRLSVRTPPNIVPRELLGLPTHPLSLLARRGPPAILDTSSRLAARLRYGDLRPLGLPPPPDGVHTTSLRGRPPVIDSGFVRLVKEGTIEIVAATAALSETEVLLADGSRMAADTVIAATGYEPALSPLVGHLGALDAGGLPLACAPDTHPSIPDLYFVGFRPKLGGFLVDFRPEAKRTARALSKRRTQISHPQ